MINRDWLITKGFAGFVCVDELWASRATKIPTEPGVYAVLREDPEPPDFLPQSAGGHFKDKDPTVPIPILDRAWIPESQVIYIGKAGHANRGPTLQKRIRQYLDFGQGKPIGHWGGRYIWQLKDSSALLFAWRPTPGIEPRTIERDLISELEQATSSLPFANLKR